MTHEQLDEFQAWLTKQAEEAKKEEAAHVNPTQAYFSGRACAFLDAFEYLAILRLQSTVAPTVNPEFGAASGSADELMLAATMLGYVSGVADHGDNPYHYTQAEAWCWEHGREQGRQHRCRCDAQSPNAERSATAGADGAENTNKG